MLTKQNNIRKMVMNLAGLFQTRHKIVHTVERQNIHLAWIKKYHVDVEILMHKILDELKTTESILLLSKNGRAEKHWIA